MASDLNLNELNSLFSQLQEMVQCGYECQQNKEIQELKEKMNQAKSKIESAPSDYEKALKQYVTFTAGESAYNDLRKKLLKKKADEKTAQLQKEVDDMAETINGQIEVYEGIYVNYNNVKDLYVKYKKENEKLMKKFKNTTNDVLTNERKTFYQDQQVDVLKFYYYYIFLIIYYICVACFGVFSLLYPSKTDWKILLATFLLFILLPFVSTWFLGVLIYFVYAMYSLVPKNVYKQDLDATLHYNYFKNL